MTSNTARRFIFITLLTLLLAVDDEFRVGVVYRDGAEVLQDGLAEQEGRRLVLNDCSFDVLQDYAAHLNIAKTDHGALAYAAIGCHETGLAHNITVGQIVVLQHKVGLKR